MDHQTQYTGAHSQHLGELHHFTRMPELMAETKIQDFTKFRKQVSLLKQSFDEIFADFQEDVMCSFSQILF
jgi:hypothetical protein